MRKRTAMQFDKFASVIALSFLCFLFSPHADAATISSSSANAAQATLTITSTTLTETVGTPITLTTVGGSGSGAVGFATTGTGCSVSGTSLAATAATTCAVTATKAASTGYLAAASVTKSFVFANVAQAPLTIANTTLTSGVGIPITLSTLGGSGSGVASYAATGNYCSISGASLVSTVATTCVVTATKATSAGWLAATSATKSFSFAGFAQATLSIVNTTLTGTAGTPITLTTSGGSGAGAVSYSVTGTGCSVSGTSLTATDATTCLVTAIKAASTPNLLATSAAKSFTFANAAQATLSMANTTLTGTAGTPITLTTSGGSGSGTVSYLVTGTGCSISSSSLNATDATTCVVTATKTESTGFLIATSASTSFTFKTCATGGTCLVGSIGPGGGTVFYVATAGFNEVGAACSPSCHFLEAAPTTGTNAWFEYAAYIWSGIKTKNGHTGTAIGTGLANTQAMVSQDSVTGRAGTNASAYRGPSNLSDWFLPSKDELNQLYLARSAFGSVADFYWSSSEDSASNAWLQYFNHREQSIYSKVDEAIYVWPIRAF